jgi:hypothetical protein
LLDRKNCVYVVVACIFGFRESAVAPPIIPNMKPTMNPPPMIALFRRCAGFGVRIAVWFRCNLNKQ